VVRANTTGERIRPGATDPPDEAAAGRPHRRASPRRV